jgi:anthranilate synthase component 1
MFGISKSTLINSKLTRKLKIKKISFEKPPLEVFLKLYNNYDSTYILESIEGPKKLSQYSFIGFAPTLTITIKKGEAVIRNNRSGDEERKQVDEPLAVIKETVRRIISVKEQRFIGGAVGYISYDAVRCWEKLPEKSVDDQNFPDVEVGVFDDGIVYDHRNRQALYYHVNENRLHEIAEMLKGPNENRALAHKQLKVNISKEQFEDAVEKAKEYVTAGDIFQVVLSKRYDFQIKGDLVGFYRNLREINPSPYMYFLKSGKHQIVGSSPEMLARVENRTVETFPIAGTRPHVKDPKENKRLTEELLGDPKERAEHVMLVDLGRNDIGKVSKFGSVQLPEFMQVHQYSHVQHIVSRVVGNLRDEYDCYDALRAVFPAGTVSGAPKVRAMEIIEELEPTRRGPYAGAVGYFSYNGNADFAITIRTLIANGDKAHIQVGAGIVADSDPEKEWFETEHKAQALIKALEVSGSGKE